MEVEAPERIYSNLLYFFFKNVKTEM